MDYNNELIGIIDKIHSNVDTQATTTTTTHNCCCPTLSASLAVTGPVAAQTEAETMVTATTRAAAVAAKATPALMTTNIPNLIDFDDCQQQCKHSKSTETSSLDEISIQNVCTLCAAFVVSSPISIVCPYEIGNALWSLPF